MTEPSVEVAETAADSLGDFGGFLRSAGKLAVARQVSALCLIGVVFVLPALTTRAIAIDFVWAYFAMLTLTSLLGLGLERLAGTAAAARGDMPLSRALAPVLFLRLVSTPLAAVGMWALFAFVGVSLSSAAWWATLVWIVAGLVAPVVFGALRASGNSSVEPVTMLMVRGAQAVSLAIVSSAGAPVAVLVASVAALECAGVVVGLRSVGQLGATRGAWTGWRTLPLRQALALAGIDVVGIMNLRADLLLVGHVLGAAPGAVYGLLYRAVDGFNGAIGSAGLWLYAESSNQRDGGTQPAGIRARSLTLLPRLGVMVAMVVVLCSAAVGALVPRLASEVGTLRILAVAFPVLSVNAIEVQVRSGRGRNREILAIYCATLAVNVPLCLVAIAVYGLPGAAAALAISELLEATLLWCTASRAERALVGPALATATAGALLLVLTGVAVGAGRPALAALGALATLLLVVRRVPWPARPHVVAS